MTAKFTPIIIPIFIGKLLPGLSRLLDLMPDTNWKMLSAQIFENDRDRSIIETYKALSLEVCDQVSAGQFPLSVAGDCVSSLGFLRGLELANVRPDWILWLDAHGDFHTEKTSQSNFLGGMPLAKLVGRGDQTLMKGIGTTAFPEAQIIHCDGRDLDDGEDMNLQNSPIRQISCIEDLPSLNIKGDSIYIHFDTDVLSKTYVPAQNYAVGGGPSPRQLAKYIKWLSVNCDVVGCSVSSWNPDMADADQSALDSLSVLKPLFDQPPTC